MLDLLIVFFLLMYIVAGLFSPAVAFCGYLWVDLLQPQLIGFGFSTSIPFSIAMAAVCILSMIFNRRQVSSPTSPTLFFLIILFIVWFHFTTTWASHPARAEYKLDWASKSLGFMLIGFLVINTRAALELFLLTFMTCAMYFALQVGVKTIVSGGSGYGQNMIHGGSNNLLSESSTLAGVSVACIPLLILYSRRSILFVTNRRFKLMLAMTGVLFLVCVIGTYARTGLLCLAVLSVGGIVLVKHRVRLIFGIILMVVMVYLVGGEQWRDRMETMYTPTADSSALGRIVVWRWTWDYVKSNPLGGGFEAFLDNEGQLGGFSGEDDVMTPVNTRPLAYHNVFFEVLGEHGYPGILIFLTILLIAFAKLLKSMRFKPILALEDENNLDWVKPTAFALFLAFSCVLITLMFVSGAYRPVVYVFIISASFLARTVKDAGKTDRETELENDSRQWAV